MLTCLYLLERCNPDRGRESAIVDIDLVSTQVKFVKLFLHLLFRQENLVRSLSASTMQSVSKLQTGTLNAGALSVTLKTPPRERPTCAETTTNRTLPCASLDWNPVSFRHGYRKNTTGFVVSKHYGL